MQNLKKSDSQSGGYQGLRGRRRGEILVKSTVLCWSQPVGNQCYCWTDLCDSYHDCKMPSAITNRKLWGRGLLLKGLENYTALLGPHSKVRGRKREERQQVQGCGNKCGAYGLKGLLFIGEFKTQNGNLKGREKTSSPNGHLLKSIKVSETSYHILSATSSNN